MIDIALHCAVAAAMGLCLLLLPPFAGGPIVIAFAFLFRELAQKDSGDVVAAALSMPRWPLAKHLEWLAPGLVAAGLYAWLL